jgi:hypothetical protein
MPPVITFFEPPDKRPIMIIGNELNFSISAYDPEEQPLAYFYRIGDSLVSNDRHYTYEAEFVGEEEITAFVTDGEKYSSVNWTVEITNVPDSIPPAQVQIISLEKGSEPGQLSLRWIAVGADSMEGLPSRYIVRTSTVAIIDEYGWLRATDRPGEPPPAFPGQVQEMVIQDLIPAHFVYVAIRAVDEFANISPLSESPGARSKGMEIYGEVGDAVTGAPIEGVEIRMASHVEFTGASGTFLFMEMPPFDGDLLVRDETEAGVYGSYFDFRRPYTASHRDTLSIWLLPNTQLDTELYPDFLLFFKCLTNTEANPFGNILRTWETPYDFYIPPFSKDGLDYAGTIADILDEYEALTGKDLFRLVDSPPDVGVVITYGEPLRDVYRVLEWSSGLRFPVKSEIELRKVYSIEDSTSFRVVVRHEVGHALGMVHSIDENHLMYGGLMVPRVTHMSQDELKVLWAMYRMLRGTSLDLYEFD